MSAKGATPSLSGTEITTPSQMTDSKGDVWTLNSNGTLDQNGKPDPTSRNVKLLLNFSDSFYQENDSDNWYSYDFSTHRWSQVDSGDPRKTSPNGSVSTGDGVSGALQVVDGSHNVWAISSTGYVYKNGIQDATSRNVTHLLYYNGNIYQENKSDNWYAFNGKGWTQISGDPDSGVASGPTPTPAPAGWGPHIVQYNTYTSPKAPPPYTAVAPFVGNSEVKLNNFTRAGDALWVVATVSDYGGIHTVTVTDTQGNNFVRLEQENDGRPGAQTVVHFYAANIRGSSSELDTITVNWSSDNYKGVLAAEIGGVTSSPLVGSSGNIQDNLSKGTNNVNSASISVSSSESPALMVALSMSTDGGGSDTGGNNCAGPTAGSGFTQVEELWNWSTVSIATFETMSIKSAKSQEPLFSAPCAGPYVTVSAVFK